MPLQLPCHYCAFQVHVIYYDQEIQFYYVPCCLVNWRQTPSGLGALLGLTFDIVSHISCNVIGSTKAAFISGVTICSPNLISCSKLRSLILMGWNFLRKCAENAFRMESHDVCSFPSSSIIWFIGRLAWRFLALKRWYKEESSSAVLSWSALSTIILCRWVLLRRMTLLFDVGTEGVLFSAFSYE